MRPIALLLVVSIGCGGDDADPPACDEAACAAQGQLCEGEVCVDPWRWGSPEWSTCPDEPRATPESLAEKAAGYDARANALHSSPELPWLLDVALAGGVDPTTATRGDVAAWWSGENDGLWTGLYLASQAYRHAVTGDADALFNVAWILDGEELRMAITGVPGLFTRQLIPPGVAGLACPTDPAMYVPSPDKRGNKWVRIGDDGCAQVADAGGTFSSTSHCGLDDFIGWCFLDNVSQDEYVGHMFGLAAVARLVDDPAVRGRAVALLQQIGDHLIANDMVFVDWDDRQTQWGKIYPGAPGDTPGYLAVMGMSFLAVIAEATGDPDHQAAYDEIAVEYPTYLDMIDLWDGDAGCGSNWNNISMLSANFHHLLWHEHDPARRAVLETAFDVELMRHPGGRAAIDQKNAWFDILWASQKRLGADSDGPAFAAVEDAVCQLRQFPASNHVVARDTTVLAAEACLGRSGESLAAAPFDTADRCAATFVWWQNPYERRVCAEEPALVKQPTGYLLAYWMARYYGFVTASQ
jgi:hypothetical protein